MSAADTWIKRSTAVAVVIVAVVAASISCQHALDVITAHSRPSRLNLVAPLCIDGVVYSSSMVLLNDARRGLDAHWLAYLGLGLGISATLAINVLSGLPYGIFGAVPSAWPAVALVLSYELLMVIVRRSAQLAGTVPEQPAGEPAPVPVSPAAELNGTGHEALALFADEVAAGTMPGVRKIRKEMHLGSGKATAVRDFLARQVDGGHRQRQLRKAQLRKAENAPLAAAGGFRRH